MLDLGHLLDIGSTGLADAWDEGRGKGTAEHEDLGVSGFNIWVNGGASYWRWEG